MLFSASRKYIYCRTLHFHPFWRTTFLSLFAFWFVWPWPFSMAATVTILVLVHLTAVTTFTSYLDVHYFTTVNSDDGGCPKIESLSLFHPWSISCHRKIDVPISSSAILVLIQCFLSSTTALILLSHFTSEARMFIYESWKQVLATSVNFWPDFSALHIHFIVYGNLTFTSNTLSSAYFQMSEVIVQINNCDMKWVDLLPGLSSMANTPLYIITTLTHRTQTLTLQDRLQHWKGD
jgi:hypothetical protein